MSDTLLYTSRCTLKSFWHEYRIYDNHLELETGFGAMKVPFEHIERVEICPPTASAQGMRLHLHPLRLRIAKLDWSDLTDHIMLDKDSGLFRRVDFTPVNPTEFKAELDMAVATFTRSRKPSIG